MKKFLLASLGALALGGFGFSHMEGMQHSQGMKMGMGHMGMSPMMGIMMSDPEIRSMVMEHMRQCRQELMNKLMSNPKVMEKMLNMMAMHPEAFQKALENNPELRKKLREMLK